MAYSSLSPSLPSGSLIVCSRNRPHLLSETVESILTSDELPAELLVIDQSDRPHPLLAVRETGHHCVVRYLWVQSRGVSRARNAGIAAAVHDILAFVDDDIIVASHWYGTLVRALVEAGTHGVVTGQVRPIADETGRGFAPSTVQDEHPAVYGGRVGKDVLFAANMAIYRAALEAVGVFDERLGPGSPFPGAEDNDLGFRLLEDGYRVHYVPEAVVYHRAWRSERAYIPLSWGYGRGQGAFYAKHLRRNDRYMLRRMGRDITGYLIRGGHHLVQGRLRRACGDLATIIGVISGAWAWRAARRRAP